MNEMDEKKFPKVKRGLNCSWGTTMFPKEARFKLFQGATMFSRKKWFKLLLKVI
jgi:hypothetical protein